MRAMEKCARAARSLTAIFSIDVRSLAAMRIGLGLVMLWDLAMRAVRLTQDYSDDGILPRAVIHDIASQLRSLYFISGTAHFAAALFAVHAIFALLFTIGYRTWVATLGCVALEWSLINRNPALSGGGDSMIVWLLIWSVFLPMGAAISVDRLIRRRLHPDVTEPASICTPASAGLLLQALMVYLCTVAARVGVESWMSEFSAIHYILHANSGTPLGQAISHWHTLTWLLTMTAVVTETIGPPIALVTARWPIVRTAVVVAFIFFHLSIWLTIHVSIFSTASMAMWMAFVPGWTWDRLGATSVARATKGLITRIGAILSAPGAWLARVAPPLFAPAPIGWFWSWPVKIAASVLLAYVAAVNASSALPAQFRHLAGPIARMPKAKQGWNMMDRPSEDYDIAMRLEAQLADGSSARLVEGPLTEPLTILSAIWPPQETRVRGYENIMIRDVARGNRKVVNAYADYYRRVWNATHPPKQRVKSMRVVIRLRELPNFHAPEPTEAELPPWREYPIDLKLPG